MSFDRNARIGWMKEEAKKRLLLLDGSWGVMIQGFTIMIAFSDLTHRKITRVHCTM